MAKSAKDKRPLRHNLYDRLNLSVATVNKIIYALIGLIVLAALAGISIR